MWAFISNSHNRNVKCYFWHVQTLLCPSSYILLSLLYLLSLRWRMSTITLLSPRTPSTTQLSWRTRQRMCQSSVSKRRTLISPPLPAAWVIASLLATRRISSLSTQEQVRVAVQHTFSSISAVCCWKKGWFATEKRKIAQKFGFWNLFLQNKTRVKVTLQPWPRALRLFWGKVLFKLILRTKIMSPIINNNERFSERYRHI